MIFSDLPLVVLGGFFLGWAQVIVANGFRCVLDEIPTLHQNSTAMATTAPLEQKTAKMTSAAFRDIQFPDDDPFTYELINGQLVKKSAPKPIHQLISQRIEFALANFLKGKALGPFFHAPVDVFFDDYNTTQPDICFVSTERAFLIDLNEGIMGAPDLIVEILSPGSLRYDRGVKKDLYERFAVKEYWIADPNNRSLEIYTMRENAYITHGVFEPGDNAGSVLLAGFELDVAELFAQ